ncbi:hypothetical protein [Cystobacter ferrugineus]|uniref:Uncharacterized protein n=1 Tax=Cystobacter ferrugineus TaxID=83449 RepID=A0A1L9B0H7_9BACT|nr:hypothetical protein [Cystobacter ferrugineus]OJH35769.1 hypothetical protein BON30_37605 [Cystobacter ferrugineus]
MDDDFSVNGDARVINHRLFHPGSMPAMSHDCANNKLCSVEYTSRTDIARLTRGAADGRHVRPSGMG